MRRGIALLALAACEPARPASPPPSSVEVTLSPGEAPPPPPEPAPAPAPSAAVEALPAPAKVGCALRSERVITPLEPALPLCLAPEGPCFAAAASRDTPTKITLTWGEGDARHDGVHVELGDEHLTVRGMAPTAAVRLSPRLLFTMGSPTAAGDFIVPFSRVLVVESAARGVATVTLAPDPAVGVPGGVRTERRCNELQLDAGRFKDEDVLRFVAGKPVPARQKGAASVLRADVDTKLASSPGQPQVASLRPRDDAMRAVDVIERRGREARIFWRRDGYAVFGWVPAAAVKAPAGDEHASMWGTLGAPPQRAVVANTRCGNDLPLLVEMAGRRFEVGVVRKGASFAVGAKRDGFVGIELAGGPVELDPGAAWIVREADFARACGGR